MMPLVKDNYYRNVDHGKDFTVKFDPLPTQFKNFHEESKLAAIEIESNKTGKLHLMYSGGVDSENTLMTFLDLGIPIVPVIIDMGKYNEHDIKFARKFCEDRSISPLIVDIDFDHFVTSGKMVETAIICQSELPHRTLTAYVIGQLDGTIICGDGEPYIGLDKTTNSWNVVMNEHEFAVYNYYLAKGIHGTTHFNSYRPEMMAAFFSDSRIIDLANNRCIGKEGSNSSKFIIYNRHSGFNMVERPKYHGYENILESKISLDPAFEELEQIGKQWSGKFSMDYFEFMRSHNLCTQ